MSSSTHPHVKVIEAMTAAAVDGDRDALAKIFTDDMQFHVRGPFAPPSKVGDHDGVDGFFDVIGTIFEECSDDVKLEALLISADDTWATEWEHAVLGRNGQKLDTHNVFAYRFEGDRIAEMWAVCTAPAGSEAFWS
jgi:ketosteroid isomerase-like protein